jgi:uncharacterized OB-fold protein
VSDVTAKPGPVPTPTSAPFWDGLAHGEVRAQRCDACGAWVHYPRHRCPACLADRLTWHTIDRRGTVYTFTVARRPTHPVFADEIPQIIAVVELEHSLRMTTTLVGVEPSAVRIGLPVIAVFDVGDDGVTLLRFTLDVATNI